MCLFDKDAQENLVIVVVQLVTVEKYFKMCRDWCWKDFKVIVQTLSADSEPPRGNRCNSFDLLFQSFPHRFIWLLRFTVMTYRVRLQHFFPVDYNFRPSQLSLHSQWTTSARVLLKFELIIHKGFITHWITLLPQ